MCRITGIINLKDTTQVEHKLIDVMTNSLKHRGPDDSGTFIDTQIALGHRRLSILDLSKKGHQPMKDSEGKIIVVFNGEIYNFKEIRKELKKEGLKFNSNTDTEVIIQAYKKWGIECVKKFNGMFAFCLYDKNKNKKYLVRDRLGIKPLYYTKKNSKIIFGSEIKTILLHPDYKKAVNAKAISSYLSYRQVIGNETLFKDIFEVLPGHYLEIGTNIKEVEYWDVKQQQQMKNEKKAISEVKKILTNSIKKRMISDVPIGAYLSGGLDSSIIVGVMSKLSKQPIKTFSVAFKEEEFNELAYAKQVATMHKTEHHELVVSTKQYLKTMKELIKYKDLPLGVPNEVPLFLMSKELKKHITVVLSGEGADEIFGGYGRIFDSTNDYYKLKISKLPGFNLFFKKFNAQYTHTKFNSPLEHFIHRYSYFPWEEKEKLFTEELKKSLNKDEAYTKIFAKHFNKAKGNYFQKLSYTFEKTHLVGLLKRVDTTTMATAVEARVPFIDHELVNYALSLSKKLKIRWKNWLFKLVSFNKTSEETSEKYNTTKYVLRKAFKELLPETVIKRKKQGFPVPLTNWFSKDFKKHTEDILLNPNAKIKKYFNQTEIKNFIEKNAVQNIKRGGQKIWMLINLELWLQEYF